MPVVSKRTARRVFSDLGRRVAELRVLRELTQERLSELLSLDEPVGWSNRQIQRIEAGGANLSIEALVKLADVLGVDVSELFEPPVSSRRPRPGRPVRP